jgi:inward rectifier potassium channel
MINKDGSFNATKLGTKFSVCDLFQYFINLRWLQFNPLVIGFYFFINILFALVYWVLDCQIVDAAPKIPEFFTAFIFSVETFITLGYGTLSSVRGLYFTISFI